MKELNKTKFFIIKWAILLNIFLVIISLFFNKMVTFGFFVGGLMSIINFHLLSLSLKKAVSFSPMKARFYVVVNYLLRYILLGFSFYTAIKRPDVSIVATIIAFLSVKVVILISNIFNFYPYEEEITRKEGG